LQGGKAGSSTTVTVSTLLERDSAGATAIRSKGEEGYNILAYNTAAGDGSTDATTALQSAIDAAQTSGGKVIVPAGVYCITAVTIGDGSASQINTKSPIAIEGIAGPTSYSSGSSNDAPVIFKHCASNPGSTRYMFTVAGPTSGGSILRNSLLQKPSLQKKEATKIRQQSDNPLLNIIIFSSQFYLKNILYLKVCASKHLILDYWLDPKQ
jgi:hypothetical protein